MDARCTGSSSAQASNCAHFTFGHDARIDSRDYEFTLAALLRVREETAAMGAAARSARCLMRRAYTRGAPTRARRAYTRVSGRTFSPGQSLRRIYRLLPLAGLPARVEVALVRVDDAHLGLADRLPLGVAPAARPA